MEKSGLHYILHIPGVLSYLGYTANVAAVCQGQKPLTGQSAARVDLLKMKVKMVKGLYSCSPQPVR